MYCIIMKSRYIMIYYVIQYIMSHDVNNNIVLYSQGTGLIHTFFLQQTPVALAGPRQEPLGFLELGVPTIAG